MILTFVDATIGILILMIVYGLWVLVGEDLSKQAVDTHRIIKHYQERNKSNERSRK